MYCSNCGSEYGNGANFCSNCGRKIGDYDFNKEKAELISNETINFSSRFILGGNILTPDRLIITSKELIYKKRNKYLIGIDEIAIPFRRISSIEIDRKLISSTIIIYTMGNEIVNLRNFSISDAKEIREILNLRINLFN